VRASLVDYLWGGAGYPTGLLPTVQHLPCDGDPPPPRGPYASDFPRSVPGLALWLDATDSSTVLTDGDRVFRWQDKSGGNNDASQTDATLEPMYLSSGINSKPAVSFDGIDDFLDISDAPSLNVDKLTMFLVLQFSSTSNSDSPAPLVKLPMDSAYQVRLELDKT